MHLHLCPLPHLLGLREAECKNALAVAAACKNPLVIIATHALSAVLSRWERINMVRTLSTAARDDGGAAGAKFGAQFARQERESVALRTQRNQERAQAIFNRQACPMSLHTSRSESTDAQTYGRTLALLTFSL